MNNMGGVLSEAGTAYSSRAPEFTPSFLVGSVLLIFFSFLCCPIMCLYVLSSVLCCLLRFPHKTIVFGSSLPSVVCRRAHVLFTLFVFVCVQWCSTHIILWLCFVCLCLVYPILPVSLDSPFTIAPSVFSNVYEILRWTPNEWHKLPNFILY